ncbi:GDSL-type esterase/lipase family protein [Sandarakinorhabdus sp. AAP62]|uniref:SGNH/GDSL hydrolase family protein n=1 Tax=Sandarakinorhabdus sp. AAP62 TaxID=1248916 RepID=UPI0002FD7F9B|nr:GDSL-type esterase/lipase family protein [Sandarakinorhabdus sp. AAP62]
MSEPASPSPAFLLIDRAAVLFCGVAAGIAIGLAFAPQLQSLLGDGAPMAIAGAAPAQAVDSDGLPQAVAAAADVPAGLARAVAEQRPYRIGVFGDSFGDGLWAALYGQLPRREAFQVLRYSEQATGFTRYSQANLEERLAATLAEGPVDVAVISFGANDTQGIYVGGKVAPLLSSRWRTEIAARITRYIDLLRGQGASVVWVGLPVMRDARYQAQVQGLNAFYAELMAELGVPFIDTSRAAVDGNGRYASHLPGPDGVPYLVRAGDGIHMSMKGYRLLTAALATRLRAWGQAARAGKPVTPDLVPPPAPLQAEPAAEATSVEPALAAEPEAPPPAEPPASVPAEAAPATDTPSAPTQLLPPAAQTPPQPPQAEPAEPRL